MSIFSGNSFQDRQTAAANAKKAQAEKFLAKTKYDPNDPAVIEREANRRAVLEARAQRAAQRQVQKEAAEAELALKLAAEKLAREEALKAEAIAREIAHAEKRAREEALEAERKLERDARYAARKARKNSAQERNPALSLSDRFDARASTTTRRRPEGAQSRDQGPPSGRRCPRGRRKSAASDRPAPSLSRCDRSCNRME